MAVIASDDFNRANANPIGGNWVTTSGESAMQLLSNQAQYSNSGADCSAYYNTTWPNDQYSQVKVSGATTAGGGSGSGLITRQASGARTHYRVVITADASSNVELAKFVSGSFTQLWSRTASYAAGRLLRLESQGTTQRVFYNGSQLGADATDSAISSGFAGIGYSSTDTGSAMDDWEGGDFTSASFIPRPPLSLNQAVKRAAYI